MGQLCRLWGCFKDLVEIFSADELEFEEMLLLLKIELKYKIEINGLMLANTNRSRQRHRQRDRQADRQTDMQAGRQAGR